MKINDFFEYIKTLYPFMDEGNFSKLMMIFAETFIWLHNNNYISSQNYFVYSCDDIKKIAGERNILLFSQDTEKTIKEKTYTAYDFLKKMTTKNGMKEIISKYYDKEFEIYNACDAANFLLDYSELDEQGLGINGSPGFVVEVYEELNATKKKEIADIINKVKPCHIDFYINEIFEFPVFNLDIGELNFALLT